MYVQPQSAHQTVNSNNDPLLVISDVGADFLKPFFVIGSVITAVSFALTLVEARLLQHQQRLLPAQRRSAKFLSYCAIGGASLGGLALILLSGFDIMSSKSVWFGTSNTNSLVTNAKSIH